MVDMLYLYFYSHTRLISYEHSSYHSYLHLSSCPACPDDEVLVW